MSTEAKPIFDENGRTCTCCKEYKEWHDFYNRRNGKNGKDSRCKTCVKESNRTAPKGNPAIARRCLSCHQILPISHFQKNGERLSRRCISCLRVDESSVAAIDQKVLFGTIAHKKLSAIMQFIDNNFPDIDKLREEIMAGGLELPPIAKFLQGVTPQLTPRGLVQHLEDVESQDQKEQDENPPVNPVDEEQPETHSSDEPEPETLTPPLTPPSRLPDLASLRRPNNLARIARDMSDVEVVRESHTQRLQERPLPWILNLKVSVETTQPILRSDEN